MEGKRTQWNVVFVDPERSDGSLNDGGSSGKTAEGSGALTPSNIVTSAATTTMTTVSTSKLYIFTKKNVGLCIY